MMNVLVTGGTGFVGHWMRKTQPKGFDATYIGTREYNQWDWHHKKWDSIVHLAPVPPDIVIGCARRLGARLLYCSSGIIYHPENNNVYRQNKIRWEGYCRDSDADVVIARLFTFYGEHLSNDHIIVAFKEAAERGEPLRIWGDGKTIRSYMHGSEMAEWMWAILLHGERGEAYDVGSDVPITILHLAESFVGRYPTSKIVIENSKPDPMPVYLPEDVEKTKALLQNGEQHGKLALTYLSNR